ncbi:hypothetical protein QMA77_20220 [Pantoea ananatis]|uniref:hypothetical protein n=1 Tax=Pantoea ananas TaxID=553 RepID=UPI001B3022FB|nr:hypothetical protein [Pantoea ananatis]MDI6539253.1 hypothetical protein [Pantoea ananatis]UYL03008.1 hypothetical protein NG830_06650 [Pantoea ananatis]
MSKNELIAVLKTAQEFYSKALAANATSREPTPSQQDLQDRLFAGYGRVTKWLETLL